MDLAEDAKNKLPFLPTRHWVLKAKPNPRLQAVWLTIPAARCTPLPEFNAHERFVKASIIIEPRMVCCGNSTGASR
jgi:hypothetical protein